MSEMTSEQLVAEAEKVNAERTALIAWLEDSLAAERAQAAKATDADTQFWATWTAHHFERVLSLLTAEGERMKELEAHNAQLQRCVADHRSQLVTLQADRDRLTAEVEVLKVAYQRLSDVAHTLEQQRDKAEAEVTRLTKQWAALKAWHGYGSTRPPSATLTKMLELEAQR